MFSNKKGMSIEQVIQALLILFAFAILLFILLYVFKPTFLNDYWPCRLNVLFRTKMPVLGMTSPLDLRMCKTSNNEISVKTKDEVVELFADRMGNCWGKYWNGKVDFFSDWSFTREFRCMICNVDRFKNFEGKISVKEIENIINRKNSLGGKVNFGNSDNTFEIKKDEPFYTVFLVRKVSEEFLNELSKGGWAGLGVTVAGGLIGCGVGLVAGPAGCAALGTMGLKVGLGIGATASVVYPTAHKEGFIPAVYLFDGEIGKTCTTLE